MQKCETKKDRQRKNRSGGTLQRKTLSDAQVADVPVQFPRILDSLDSHVNTQYPSRNERIEQNRSSHCALFTCILDRIHALHSKQYSQSEQNSSKARKPKVLLAVDNDGTNFPASA